MTSTEIAARARELYETNIRQSVEAGNVGRYIVIDAASGDYEVADEYVHLARRLRSRRPDAKPYIIRIGYPALGRIGARARPVSA